MSDVEPVRREVVVDADPVTAFDVFTTGIGRWWPLAELSVHGAGGTVGFEDGELVERGIGGEASVWGEITRWEPPSAIAFTWHPGRSPERASHVEVTFTPSADQTSVVLVHVGWDGFDDPQTARDEYDHGWPDVLERYRREIDDSAEVTWVALVHSPGPAAPSDGSLFDDPRFFEHVAFLQRMQAAGYLVAAGPLGDTFGDGMTILRLPGSGQTERARRLATEDDQSVACGFFLVSVRPWNVMLHA
jgi:uncharacterized protein YndB with AHSA1/START domain/uncharacterized protein YciI